MTDPLVTVVIPSYNQGAFLEKAIESVLIQNTRLELFVMDGGSTDESLSVIHKYQDRLKGWRSAPDNGQAAAINEGILLGNAPYVCWLNSDDFFLNNGLDKLVKCIESNNNVPFVYGKCWTSNANGKSVFPYLTMPFNKWLFANFCFIAQPATLIRREVWERVGGLNSEMNLAFDYELWWKIIEIYGAPGYCKKFVASSRDHESTKTRNNLDEHYQESIAVVKKYYHSVPLKWKVFLNLMRVVRRVL